MNGHRFTGPIAGAAIFLLCLPAVVSQASGNTPRTPANPLDQSAKSSQQAVKSFDALLAKITLTDDEKTKIDQIRRDFNNKFELVAKDPHTNPDQKAAMIGGFQRLERTQIFEVLTPVQRDEMRKNALAEHAANQPGPGYRRPSRPAQTDIAPAQPPAAQPR